MATITLSNDKDQIPITDCHFDKNDLLKSFKVTFTTKDKGERHCYYVHKGSEDPTDWISKFVTVSAGAAGALAGAVAGAVAGAFVGRGGGPVAKQVGKAVGTVAGSSAGSGLALAINTYLTGKTKNGYYNATDDKLETGLKEVYHKNEVTM